MSTVIDILAVVGGLVVGGFLYYGIAAAYVVWKWK